MDKFILVISTLASGILIYKEFIKEDNNKEDITNETT